MKKIQNSKFKIQNWLNGYTLIELIIVIVFIGAVATIGISTFTSFNRSQLFGSGVSEVSNMLSTARSKSIAQVADVCGSNSLNGYKVIPTRGGNNYSLYAVCNGADTLIGTAKKLPGALTFQSDSIDSILFDVSTGEVRNPGAVIITGYDKSQYININNTGLLATNAPIPAPTPGACSGLSVLTPTSLNKTIVVKPGTITGSVTYKNNCTTPYSISSMKIVGKSPVAASRDFTPVISAQTINAGATITVNNASLSIVSGDLTGRWTAYATYQDNSGTWHDDSNVLSFQVVNPDTTAPSTPTGFTASNITETSVDLDWSANSPTEEVTSYVLTRSPGSTIDVGNVTSYNVTGLTAWTNYTFTLKAKDGAGNLSTAAGTTPAVTQTDDMTNPSVPTWPAAAIVTTHNSATPDWNASTDTASGVASYTLQRAPYTTSCGTYATIASGISGTSYNDTGLSPTTTYCYKVRAVDNAGNLSAFSTAKQATTTAEPNIIFRASSTGTATGTTSITLTKPTGTLNGDVMLAIVTATSNGCCEGAINMAATGWTRFQNVDGGATFPQASLYWKVATSSDSMTWSISGNSTNRNWAGGIASYDNVHATTPIDVSSSNYPGCCAYASDTITALTITPTSATDTLLFFAMVKPAGKTIPNPTGMTGRFNPTVNLSLKLADQYLIPQSATGNKTSLFTPTSSAYWTGFLVGLKKAP